MPKIDPSKNYKQINQRKLFETTASCKYGHKKMQWTHNNGGKQRFLEIYKQDLKNKVLDFILYDLKKHPEIIVLGPGLGHDTILLKKELESYGIKPMIDTLNLTQRELDEKVAKKIREDHSQPFLPFEKINEVEHSVIVKKLKHKYDIFVAPASVGTHTKSAPYALFQSSLLLKVGGRGFIEIFLIDRKGFNEIEIAKRMLKAYNKTAKEKVEVDFKFLEDTLSKETGQTMINGKEYAVKIIWVEINRKK
jgi:hypothetical protein